MKKKTIKLFVILGVGLFIFYIGAIIQYNVSNKPTLQPTPSISSPEPANTLSQDPTMISYMQELNLDYSKLNLIYGQDAANIVSGGASFTEPNTIYLGTNLSGPELYRALSHEYIHYAQVVDRETSKSLYEYTNNLYMNDSWLYDRMQKYRDGTACSANCIDLEAETQAVMCTEVPDYVLTQDYIDWCNKHLPMREELFIVN